MYYLEKEFRLQTLEIQFLTDYPRYLIIKKFGYDFLFYRYDALYFEKHSTQH